MTGSLTDYQKYIHKSRYARFLDEKGRREHWEETVDRLVAFYVKKFPKFKEEWEGRLREAILKMEVMPSMRSLMTAGPALEKDNICGYNPVAGDTLVVTQEYGNVPIKSLNGKAATVLNKNGDWARAAFRCWGEQRLYKVVLKLNSNTVKEVYATANHRWILDSDEVVSTSELSVGNHIPFVSAQKPLEDDDYILGIRHGLIYGDGTAVKSCKRVKGYHIRLCDKSRELVWAFKGYPLTYPESHGGDPVIMLYDDFAKTHDLKNLPDGGNETSSYLLGFVRGWLAADGYVSKTSQTSICCEANGKDWLYKYAEKLGFVIQSENKLVSTTNFGERTRETFRVSISRSSLTPGDLILDYKRDNFNSLKSKYVVSAVEKTDRFESVYCAEVPDTNTFVLAGGILTGNCSFLPVNHIKAFSEALYILMCGTGVGFSVERQYIAELPAVADSFYDSSSTITVRDSKLGWAVAIHELLTLLYQGQVPKFDTSKLRPAGARLKTFGGRSAGPRPLIDLYSYLVTTFKRAAGRKLTSIECHDIMCKIGEIVVVGGVRRSALISLSNLSDDRMRAAKNGQWWEENGQRALANNSAVYTDKPDIGVFMREWLSLYESKSGERGIFSHSGAVKKVGENGRRDSSYHFGTNPCAEILLRGYEFCNLSEVIIREEDDLNSLRRKVEIATIIGTFQSALTDFKYLRSVWKNNCEEERLLGVSLTGIMDNNLTAAAHSQGKLDLAKILQVLKDETISTNAVWASNLGISPSVAITCVKPSGTVSQLVDAASGIHPRFSEYYVRTVRQDKKDPLSQFLIESGIPHEDDITKPNDTYVFSFPQKAPKSALKRNDMSAIDQLKLYLIYQKNWCEHNVSTTVYVRENEWLDVGAFVYKHFDDIVGVSFLPHSVHVYKQAPYQEIDETVYNELVSKMPRIDWESFKEADDNVEGAQTLACVSGYCEI